MLVNEAQALNLTRKHFTLVAEILGHIDDKGNREGTAQAYAILFEQTHPRFNRAKFEAYVEEVHADCWADDGPIYEKGVWITLSCIFKPIWYTLLMMNDEPSTNPNANLDPQDPLRDVIQIQPEETFGGWEGSWAGDGSGLDDLADYNAMEGDDY